MKNKTLGEFILDTQSSFPGSSGELSRILSSIRLAAKIVSHETNKAGLVKDTEGKAHQIKQVQVIKQDSSEVQPPKFGKGVKERLKPALQPFANMLKKHLRTTGQIALTLAARHMNQEDGFKEAKRNLLFLDFVKLFPETFKATGKGPATKVALA